jgi:hypothetical protein
MQVSRAVSMIRLVAIVGLLWLVPAAHAKALGDCNPDGCNSDCGGAFCALNGDCSTDCNVNIDQCIVCHPGFQCEVSGWCSAAD